jgi:hypothetical protein
MHRETREPHSAQTRERLDFYRKTYGRGADIIAQHNDLENAREPLKNRLARLPGQRHGIGYGPNTYGASAHHIQKREAPRIIHVNTVTLHEHLHLPSGATIEETTPEEHVRTAVKHTTGRGRTEEERKRNPGATATAAAFRGPIVKDTSHTARNPHRA